MSVHPAYSDRQRLEAAEWFIDIQDADDPAPELLQRWTQWLEAEEGNRLAFAAIERAWHEVPEDLPAPRSASQAKVGVFLKPLAYAASFVAAVGLVWWTLGHRESPVHPGSGEFSTRTGEHMDLTLADGSRVSLGARTRLAVDFTGAQRDVRLLNGEAFFSVHKDPQRPFRVYATGGVITAVGTAFNVRAIGDRITVAVAEGAVDVAGGTARSREAPRRLKPGDQLTYISSDSAAKPQTVLTRVDPDQPARWRGGWLFYRDEPLRYVIADVGRYTDRQIALADSVPPELRFTGAVYKDSVVEWVQALPEVFPLQVQADAEGRMTVTAGFR